MTDQQRQRYRLVLEAKQSKREMEQNAKREKDRETILERMRAIGEKGETKSLLRDFCGIPSQRFNPAFAELLTEKLIEAVTVTKSNKQTYQGYRVTRTHSDSLGLTRIIRLSEWHTTSLG